MDNKKILQRIAETSAPFRRKLVNLAKLHSEAECNGDYYFDDEKNEWTGYTHAPEYKHANDNANAIKGREAENEIRAMIMLMCKTDDIPSFIGYSGDPRGFVFKIFADKLTDDERKICDDIGFMRDWGGDYTIMRDSEYNRA